MVIIKNYKVKKYLTNFRKFPNSQPYTWLPRYWRPNPEQLRQT